MRIRGVKRSVIFGVEAPQEIGTGSIPEGEGGVDIGKPARTGSSMLPAGQRTPLRQKRSSEELKEERMCSTRLRNSKHFDLPFRSGPA